MTMQITSAYNFVPLSPKVVHPEWQDLVSHDLPLTDGLCAELEIELEAHTPLLVGGQQRKATVNSPAQVDFYRLPDGRPAIPGSSLRGMIRNVLEIATFARLAPLMDDRALSLRDLSTSDNDYVRTLVDGSGLKDAQRGAKPRAQSAWLWFDGEQWRLERVASARVEQNLIKDHFRLGELDWPAYGHPARKGWRPTAEKKRKLLIDAAMRHPKAAKLLDGHLSVRVKIPKAGVHQHGDKWLAYREVERFVPMEGADTGFVEAVLVCTGQPGPAKHMEFAFLPFKRKADSHVVPPDVMAAFFQVHDDEAGDWKRLWQGLAARRVPVPVFYLGGEADDPRPVTRLGLAQMFRLPGRHRLGELAERSQTGKAPGRLDFVQTLFGHVLDGQQALKGRVAFGDLLPVPDAPLREADARFRAPTVLGQPKPGFYPNYLKQAQLNGQLKPGVGFSTILSPTAPELRGWKRYPVRPAQEVNVPAPPEKSRPTVQVQLNPLAAGCRFRGTIRLHNVQPEELGALIWALDFGIPPEGDDVTPSLRHALGLGKPFGFGQVSLRLCAPLRVRPNDPCAPAPHVAALRQRFEQYMDKQVPGWRQGEGLRELRAMADPSHRAAKSATLSPPREPKAFMEFKKREVRAVLVPYSQMGGRR